MTKGKVSICIPYCNEFPQVAFTVNNIWCEVRDKIDFEIIAIDNFCEETASQVIDIDGKKQNRVPDAGYKYLLDLSERHAWLKVLHYEDKLSHWQAKNLGVAQSDGEILLFIDAHCITSCGSIPKMINYYKNHWEELNGTLHLPLAYMLERRGLELIYKLVVNKDSGDYHYSFTRYRDAKEPYRVPCMSTCGMAMHRSIYDELGGWPKELGIYGGGENFINFTTAVLGKTINIFPTEPLYHYANKRGYNWSYNDYTRNRTIATYIFGGEQMATNWINHRKGNPIVLLDILRNVLTTCKEHREFIVRKQVMTIEEWLIRQSNPVE